MNCKCLAEKNAELKKLGFKITPAYSMLAITEDLGLTLTHGVPLVRIDGSRLRRDDPRILQISFCPFCGTKLP